MIPGGTGSPLEAAAEWVARLHADDCSEADRRNFQAWLEAAPENAAAYERASEAYALAGELDDLLPAQARPAASRRMVLAGGALAAAAAGLGFFVWRQPRAQAYVTIVGEQRRIPFADGAVLMLDTDSEVEVREGVTRAVRLVRGRANLDLSAPSARPAELAALDWRIRSAGGSFDVRCEGSDVTVFMIAGAAQLLGDGVTRALNAGERLHLGAAGVVADRPEPEKATAWQRAQIVFDGETLKTAAHELNRYSLTPLTFEDEGTANLRISGAYRVGDNAAFARSVSVLLPVVPLVRNDAIVLAPAHGAAHPAAPEKGG